MAYIVPAELPKSCCHCPFGECSFYYPFWGKDPNTKGYYCQLDNNSIGKRVLKMNADEELKADWCPLKETKGKVKNDR